jgi:hypothetical protein
LVPRILIEINLIDQDGALFFRGGRDIALSVAASPKTGYHARAFINAF